nr:unnamed protein product [Callosobruchus analis]
MEVNTQSSDAASRERKLNLEMGRAMCSLPPGEEVVISGLSGAYPMSKDIYEFQDNLFNKVNMVSPNSRWTYKHPEVPPRSGQVPVINKYDAGFFGIHEKHAHAFDCMGRMIQEKAIEALMDAGINPVDLEGSRTGVFVGVCYSENEKYWFWQSMDVEYSVWTGAQRSMIAHRISQYLKLKGPSVTVDTACSSSSFAIENAFRAIISGQIDTAIVAGSNICSHPFVSLQFARLGVLSMDCSCKAFDKAGNGYARSECVCVMVLQRAKDANRVYANVVYAKTSCDGYKEQGITYPSGPEQTHLLNEFYEDCNVNTAVVSYLEAHGTGTHVGDPEECNAMDVVFTRNRTAPFLIGSVKSNIGHTEPGSGLCSVTKCIIGMETGFIPPNLHYTKPRPEVKALVEGRMKVVTEKTPFDEKYGFFAPTKRRRLTMDFRMIIYQDWYVLAAELQRLFLHCSMNLEIMCWMLNTKNMRNHIYRGYNIVSKSGEIYRYHQRVQPKVAHLFVIFGELNDWKAVGRKLMEIPIFADSLQRTQKYLLEMRINIVDVLKKVTNRDSCTVLGNIAVQLGIVDVLSCAVAINDAFSKVCDVTNAANNGVNGNSNGIHEPTNNGYNDHTE